eukprot:359252-Chlamydomonas_euryale.AAC.14
MPGCAAAGQPCPTQHGTCIVHSLVQFSMCTCISCLHSSVCAHASRASIGCYHAVSRSSQQAHHASIGCYHAVSRSSQQAHHAFVSQSRVLGVVGGVGSCERAPPHLCLVGFSVTV